MKKNNLCFIYRAATLLVVLCLLCASCISLGGLYSGYSQLSDKQKQQVKVLETSIETIVADGNIYLVTHEQVAAFIKTHEDVLIYEYTPWCSAENCANPHEVAQLCKKKGTAFLLISTTLEDFSDLLKLKLPTFAINHHAYQTNVRSKYLRKFYDTLTGIPEKERGLGCYYLFRNGRFAQTYKNFRDAFDALTGGVNENTVYNYSSMKKISSTELDEDDGTENNYQYNKKIYINLKPNNL